MNYTVLGVNGFIGKHVAAALGRRGHSVFCPAREEKLSGRDLGVAFYCIGLTADFRQRPLDTVDAHVCVLNRVLRETSYEKLVYLSSTRVYAGLKGCVNEDSVLLADPNDPSDLYNISKLMGESACLHSGRNAVVARLSNVIGPDFSSDNFISVLMREACEEKSILLHSMAQSAKDFILLEDAVGAIIALGELPRSGPIYNIASGRNLSNRQVCEAITAVEHCKWEVVPDARLLDFPEIDISRARKDLGLTPGDVLGSLAGMVRRYREKKDVEHGYTY
ncbi:MAG: NAD(P)-dependent oxidoreductase [Candidatus Omnitrophota bacterium]|nr:NAD(P)-dependent oxidoreductase [Candidatus Omnitrophota bacterium]